MAALEQIVYGCADDICAMSPDGTNRVNLTNRPDNFESDASLYAPGGKIVYLSRPLNGTLEARYEVMDADGSNPTPVTEYMPAFPGMKASWSVDGTKILFAAVIDGDGEIFLMNADGSGRIQLTDNDAFDRDPSFSPDGSKILFQSNRDGNQELYIMNADGSDQTCLTLNDHFDWEGDFNPAGTKIAFSSDRTGDLRLYTMNPDGSGQAALFTTGIQTSPDYGPDGSRIVFVDALEHDLFVINSDGTGLINITNDGLNTRENDPSWGAAADSDSDSVPDFADPDDDNDGVPDVEDQFPLDPNESSDNDHDGTGDNADTDDDNDGVADPADNCPLTANPDQTDFDLDGIGDTCDPVTGPPSNKGQCKKGGWARFDFPRVFRNQGDCISFLVAHNRNSL